VFGREKWTPEEVAAYWRHLESREPSTSWRRDEYRQLAVSYENGNWYPPINPRHCPVGKTKRPGDEYHRHNWPR
jgi:hypothetical protein